MSQQSRKEKRLKDLLSQYKLNSPVPRDVQKHFSNEMGPMFKRVIKKAGVLGIIYGIFLSIYFYFRKFGIIITATKIIITFFTFFSIILGGYFLYSYVFDIDTDQKYSIPKIQEKGQIKKPTIENYSMIMGIERFTSSTVDTATLDFAAQSISKGLAEVRGPHFARYMTQPGAEGPYTLMGNIEKVENTYIIFIKIVDMKNSSIIYAAKERAISQEELNSAFDRISRNIASRIK